MGLLRRLFSTPVFEDDEDKSRSAGLLRIVILGMLGIIVLFVFSSLFTHENPLPFLIGAGVLFPFLFGGLYLNQRGHVRAAAILFSSFLWLFLTAISVMNGGVRGVTPVNYIMVIVVAGLILGRWGGIIFAGLSILASLGMLYADMNGFLPTLALPSTLISRWVVLSANFAVSALLLYLAAGSIAEALGRARRGERSLAVTNVELQREIAERSRVEADLRQARREWEDIFQAIGHPTVVLDPHHRIIAANQAVVAVAGKPEAELAGVRCYTIFHGASCPPAGCPLEKAKTSGHLETVEMVMAALDRTYLVSCTPIHDEQGDLQRIIHVATDITDRVEAEEGLRESEERFRSVFENAVMGLYRTTPDGRILMANPALVEMMGYQSFEELADHNLEEEGFEPSYPRSDFVQRVETDGQVVGFESAWVKRDGTTLYVSESARAIRDEAGRTLYYEGTVEDITDRRRAEETLIESEERFRSVVEYAPAGILIVNDKFQFTYVNDELCQILGFTQDEMVGMDFRQVVGEASLAQVSDYYIRRRKGEDIPSRYEITVVRKDGEKRYGELSSTVVKDSSGNIITIAQLLDITERKQAEEALRENEMRYRALFEHTNDAIFLISLDGVQLAANQRAADLLQYSQDDLVGMPVEQVVVPREYPDSQRKIASLRAGESLPIYERTFRRKDGLEVPVEINVALVRDSAGNPLHIQSFVRDITRRKRAEAVRDEVLSTLQQRTTQLQTAAEVATSASTMLDPGELIRQTVNLIQVRFGFYYVGLFLVDEAGEYAVLHAGTGDAGRQMVEQGHRLAVGGESMIGRCVASAKARIALDVGKEAVRFENPFLPETRSEMALPLISRGQCIGALTVQSSEEAAFWDEDVVALQAMADQLAVAIENARLYEQVRQYATELEDRVTERTAELAAVNKELEAFAYSVSHDLRAPLRSIDGFSQALLEDYVDRLDEEGQDFLQRVRAASQRMGQLIDDLLKLSRLTRAEMYFGAVDLSELAREIAEELQDREPGRQVDLIIAEGVVAEADARLLWVVLENLLGNAWKFTSKAPRACIEFGAMGQEGKRVYFVRDDGVGFDMAYANKLFGAFQRLHRVTEFEGSGVGLATVQRIVHRHGGRVWAEGAVDEGATFYFTLAARGEET